MQNTIYSMSGDSAQNDRKISIQSSSKVMTFEFHKKICSFSSSLSVNITTLNNCFKKKRLY